MFRVTIIVVMLHHFEALHPSSPIGFFVVVPLNAGRLMVQLNLD
jgi:hypothetical protein